MLDLNPLSEVKLRSLFTLSETLIHRHSMRTILSFEEDIGR